ncbi:NADPH-dependent methylglyoxal reductase GRE2 [Exophiala dermatitidis]
MISKMDNTFSNVLVTGATGFIGAHVVDNLLEKGYNVRAVARSKQKANAMRQARKKYKSKLDFVFIEDLSQEGAFDGLLDGIDGIIHVASPLNYSVADKEKELIIPAITGVRSILEAASRSPAKRVVMTSSFGSVLDMTRPLTAEWIYSEKDWNPITYAEAISPDATPQDAYRASKKFAEQEAWKFMETKTPNFDLVTLCPSMVFGPVAHPVSSVQNLNESNALLWRVANREGDTPLPPARFNFWIDVRDLAEIHVKALLTPQAGGKRYLPVAPEKFNYQLASEIIVRNFPSASGSATAEKQNILENVNVDRKSLDDDFDIGYRRFEETVVDFTRQAYGMAGPSTQN